MQLARRPVNLFTPDPRQTPLPRRTKLITTSDKHWLPDRKSEKRLTGINESQYTDLVQDPRRLAAKFSKILYQLA